MQLDKLYQNTEQTNTNPFPSNYHEVTFALTCAISLIDWDSASFDEHLMEYIDALKTDLIALLAIPRLSSQVHFLHLAQCAYETAVYLRTTTSQVSIIREFFNIFIDDSGADPMLNINPRKYHYMLQEFLQSYFMEEYDGLQTITVMKKIQQFYQTTFSHRNKDKNIKKIAQFSQQLEAFNKQTNHLLAHLFAEMVESIQFNNLAASERDCFLK